MAETVTLPWECEFEGIGVTYQVRLAPGCNCVLLLSSSPEQSYGSFGGVQNNGVYARLVREGKIIDVRPFLPFRNYVGALGFAHEDPKAWPEFVARVKEGI